MNHPILKACRTISEFDLSLFTELGIGVELQDFTEPALSDLEVYKTLNGYEKAFTHFSGCKAMHGSFLDIDIASFNRDIANYSKKMYLRDMFFAKVLNLDYIVFHSNIKSSYANKTALDFFISLQKDFFPNAIESTNFLGKVVIENVLDKGPISILNLVKAINHPQVLINLDVGHATLTPTPIETWFSSLNSTIGYMHLHSNNGNQDSHSPVTIEYAKKIATLLKDYNLTIPICLEYWDCNLKDEIKKLQGIL